jgi:hypothetical protein
MAKVLKNCPAGHKMTTDNTYWQSKHGNAYAVCRLCKQVQAKERKKYSFTKADQKQIAQMEVVTEDISGIKNCPKCEGILKWGEDNRQDDLVSCVYCGWRPSAKVV